MARKAKPQVLYTVKSMAPRSDHARVYTLSKLSGDLEVLALYTITEYGNSLTCSCPARKAWCKHCDILRLYQGLNKVDTGWFYDFELKTWIEPNKNEA